MGLVSDILGGGGDVPEYKPYSTRSGVGRTRVRGDVITTTLDPRYQAISEALTGGLAGGMRTGMTPEELALGAAATGRGLGFLEAMGPADPFAAAETQFGRMEEILAPGREQARAELEGKLLRQGRLGSTGGARTQAALEESIEQSRRAGLVEALQQATGLQAHQAQMAGALGGLGIGVGETQFGRQMGALSGALGLEQAPLAFAQLGTSLSGQRSQHQIAQAQMEAQKMQALMGGLGGLASGFMTGGMGPLFSAGAGALTGGLNIGGYNPAAAGGGQWGTMGGLWT